MGSEDSVEAREEGGSRRSSVGEDDRYSQKISAINEGYREKTYHYARYTRLSSLAPVPSAFISKYSLFHNKYSLFHNPQRPATKHGTWNPASSQEKHFNHPNVGSLFTAPRRIGSRVRLIDQSKNDLRDDGIRDGG